MVMTANRQIEFLRGDAVIPSLHDRLVEKRRSGKQTGQEVVLQVQKMSLDSVTNRCLRPRCQSEPGAQLNFCKHGSPIRAGLGFSTEMTVGEAHPGLSD